MSDTSITITEKQLSIYEDKIKKGLASFFEVGQSLQRIKDANGFKLRGFDTFDAYCQATFSFSERNGYRLIREAASCADLTAAGEQSLMINRLVAAWALSMLHDFLVTRDLRYFGAAIDQQWGGMRVYTIDAPTIGEACGLAAGELTVKASKR